VNSFDCIDCFILLWGMDIEKPSQDEQKKNDASEKVDQEKEIGGFENRPEPTRYGDWEVNGRCSDF